MYEHLPLSPPLFCGHWVFSLLFSSHSPFLPVFSIHSLKVQIANIHANKMISGYHGGVVIPNVLAVSRAISVRPNVNQASMNRKFS